MRASIFVPAAAVCFLLGFCAATAGGPNLLAIKPGEWLTAASGFLGVIFTISATLWIDQRRRDDAERTDLTRLAKALRALRDSAQALTAAAAGLVLGRGEAARLLPPIAAYSEAARFFDYTLANAKVPDRALWEQLRDVRATAVERLPMIELVAIAAQREDAEHQDQLEGLQYLAGALGPRVAVALRALDGRS